MTVCLYFPNNNHMFTDPMFTPNTSNEAEIYFDFAKPEVLLLRKKPGAWRNPKARLRSWAPRAAPGKPHSGNGQKSSPRSQ